MKRVFLMLALCMLVAAVSVQAAPKVTITFWYQANEANPQDVEAQWMKENLQLFQKVNPDIKVDSTYVSASDQYQTKITTEMAANNAPDVFQTWLSGRLEPFVKAGRVYPLNDVIKKDPGFKSLLVDANLVNSTFDKKVYALPNIVTSELLFYNKELFTKYGVEVPKTWEQLITAVKKFKADGIVPMSMPNKEPWVGTMTYMYIFDRIAGPNKWKETCLNHTGKFTAPEYAAAAKKFLELRDAGAFPENYNSMDYAEGKTLFINGKAAMYMMGTWEVGSLGQTMGNKVDFMPFPLIPGGKGNLESYVLSQDMGFAISSKSPNKEAANKLLKYLFSKERQAAWAEAGQLITTKNIPYNKDKVPVLSGKVIQALNTAKYGFLPWDNPLGVNVGKELNNSTQLILTGANIKETFEKLEQINEAEFGLKK